MGEASLHDDVIT
ncbi:hypothetical protein XELAEV_180009622mg, partial [Xenopus laevis]